MVRFCVIIILGIQCNKEEAKTKDASGGVDFGWMRAITLDGSFRSHLGQFRTYVTRLDSCHKKTQFWKPFVGYHG